MLCQHSGVSQRRERTTGEDDHRRAIARRHVRGGERQAVGGPKRHVLPERRDDGRSGLVGGDDRQADGITTKNVASAAATESAGPPCPCATLGPARAPQERHPAGHERDAHEAGRITVTSSPAKPVHHDVPQSVGHAGDRGEDTAHDRHAGPRAGPQPRINPCQHARDRERDKPADEMVGGRGAGLAVREGVVDHRDRDHGQRDAERERLATRARDVTADAMRRRYAALDPLPSGA